MNEILAIILSFSLRKFNFSLPIYSFLRACLVQQTSKDFVAKYSINHKCLLIALSLTIIPTENSSSTNIFLSFSCENVII